MRLKKSNRSKKSAYANTFMRLKKFAGLKKSMRLQWLGMATIAVFFVMAAAVMIGLREPYQPAHVARLDAQTDKTAAQADAKKAAPSTAPVAGPVAAKTQAADATSANAPDVESEVKASVPKPTPVTITGCLERADATFRLKDTSGSDAPKSRSWKTGFLRKGSASIAVVDAAKTLRLPDHVGQRVSVTGTITDGEMQVRSLRRVSASCTDSEKVKV